MISLRELDEIESQLDSTVPYYLSRLIKDLRTLLQVDAAPRPGPSAGELAKRIMCCVLDYMRPDITKPDDGACVLECTKAVENLLALADPPVAPASPETPRHDEIVELRRALELDAADLWRVTDAILDELRSRWWICEGRGSYEYDDDRYRDETRFAFEAIEKIVKTVQIPASTRFLDVMRRTDSAASPRPRPRSRPDDD